MGESERVIVAGLQIDAELHTFVEREVLPGLDVTADAVWQGLARLVAQAGPRTAELLAVRERLQLEIDGWHERHRGRPHDAAAYRTFLESIGYIVAEGEDFAIDTDRIDAEIASIAGPQLIVPVSNARYALNAANARWGSLYDAVYGTDVLGSRPAPGPYDQARGACVIAWVRGFLDEIFPLREGSHSDTTAYRIADGALVAQLGDGTTTGLRARDALAGYTGATEAPTSVLLTNHGLGVILVVDRHHPVGITDRAGISDVVIESAVTTIIDFEDSVAAVDAADKVHAYRNWLGLTRGDLTAWVATADGGFERALEPDRVFVGLDGEPRRRRGRALMLVRNVGHLMTTPAVLDGAGAEIGEGLLDAMMTVLIATHDHARDPGLRNSPAGSIYVVKPKLHGPDEVALTDSIFTTVEHALALAPNTVKIGVMDEERRTTVNLKECIRAVRHRLAFINTGFLDRTGDEIHTSMEAGPMVRKADMRRERWISGYEDWNVDIGLRCGLRGHAQIGKGMWAAPDNLADMLEQKIAHPRAGANCAWVPSPTAATLHALHYHRTDVAGRQAEIAAAGPRATLDDLLTIPTVTEPSWDSASRRAELDNNAQGILGYVVRWVDQGVGCSKLPDIHDVALMEDRATCRISSQHIANWLHHGIISREEVVDSLRRMAVVVDRQNAGDPHYVPMAPDYDGEAYRAAEALVLDGRTQPSGYTEAILHVSRAGRKATVRPIQTNPER